MTLKKKTILNVCLFTLIFGGLLAAATFTDLQVSRLLTAKVLAPGAYYTNHFFGAMMETVGTCPEYLIGAMMGQIIFWYAVRFLQKNALRGLILCAAAAGAGALYAMWYNEVMNYILRRFELPDGRPAFIWGVIGFLALLTLLLGTLAVRNFSDESLKKLIRFAVVSCFAMVAATLIVQGIKIPFGRMRYRAMNVLGDTSGFTRWYVAGGQPDKAWMRATFGTSDAYKSFPSGHTRSAAATFYLAAMADVLGINKKKKAALWCFAAAFTCAVALSRVMVGAHFLSDVLMGGAIGFLCCVLSKEFFVDGCKHLKSLRA